VSSVAHPSTVTALFVPFQAALSAGFVDARLVATEIGYLNIISIIKSAAGIYLSNSTEDVSSDGDTIFHHQYSALQ
jgi:hypothetical protein